MDLFCCPFKVVEVFGAKARVKVKGSVKGVPFRSSLSPLGDGTHDLVVNKELREKAGVSAGDRINIVIDVDTALRRVLVPEDFQKVLNKNKKAKAACQKFSYTHKKEYVEWIEDAKHEETRKRRIEKAVGKLTDGIRTKETTLSHCR